MSTTVNNVPLWLDIKTEYIDQNFEKVLGYLKNGIKRDTFYQTTVDLLGKRVEEYLSTLKKRPVSFSESSVYDVEKLKFETRLIAAYLLVFDDGDVVKRKRLYMPFLHSLSLLVPTNLCGELLELMVDNMIYQDEPKLHFGWDDVFDFKPQVLAHKILNSKDFQGSPVSESTYERKGCATIWGKSLGIAPMNQKDFKKKEVQMAASIGSIGGKLNLLSPKSEKIKQSDEDNIELIEKYTQSFIEEQQKVKSSTKKVKKIYSEGDSLLVEITKCVWGSIKVRSIDPDYETIEGSIKFTDSNVLYYYCEDFYKYMKVGQNIDVTLVDFAKGEFSIKDGFIAYIIEDIVKQDGHIGKTEPAKVAKIYTDKRKKQQMDWLTKSGFPVHTDYVEGFNQNDFAMIRIEGASGGSYYGYVSGVVDGEEAEPFDFQESKREVIEGFNFEGYDQEDAEPKESMMNTGTIRDLLNMMIRFQKTIIHPVERFRLLCVSLTIATLIEAEEHQSYIRFLLAYLRQLICFAKGDYSHIVELVPDGNIADIDVVQQRCQVVKILKAYDSKDSQADLESFVTESHDETLVKIAKLIQSCNIIGEIVPASTKNIIKREIVKNLSLEMEDETNLDEENGVYLGIEDLHQEFKTSFVYPPDNDMQPNYHVQEKNIFKCLCGFLNSDGGGTLYIGVTDLGYVCGIENDLKHLNLTQLDPYIRFIQDEAKKFFPVEVINQFVIKPMYDNQVIAIRVEPYTEGVVELNEKAYIRINNETREMSEKLKSLVSDKKAKMKH